jgi:hypothetical protein
MGKSMKIVPRFWVALTGCLTDFGQDIIRKKGLRILVD